MVILYDFFAEAKNRRSPIFCSIFEAQNLCFCTRVSAASSETPRECSELSPVSRGRAQSAARTRPMGTANGLAEEAERALREDAPHRHIRGTLDDDDDGVVHIPSDVRACIITREGVINQPRHAASSNLSTHPA